MKTNIPMNGFSLILVILAAGFLIWTVRRIRGVPFNGKITVLSVVYISAAIAAWFLNFGWLHFLLTIVFLPFIHAVLFLTTNLRISPYRSRSEKVAKNMHWYRITYLAIYCLLPDADDIEMRCFFGLIRNETASLIFWFLAQAAVVFHFMIWKQQVRIAREFEKERE